MLGLVFQCLLQEFFLENSSISILSSFLFQMFRHGSNLPVVITTKTVRALTADVNRNVGSRLRPRQQNHLLLKQQQYRQLQLFGNGRDPKLHFRMFRLLRFSTRTTMPRETLIPRPSQVEIISPQRKQAWPSHPHLRLEVWSKIKFLLNKFSTKTRTLSTVRPKTDRDFVRLEGLAGSSGSRLRLAASLDAPVLMEPRLVFKRSGNALPAETHFRFGRAIGRICQVRKTLFFFFTPLQLYFEDTPILCEVLDNWLLCLLFSLFRGQ